MKENLRVTKYRDGVSIPLDVCGGSVGDGTSCGTTLWKNRTHGAYAVYAHSETNVAKYGYLYNWYAAKGYASSSVITSLCPIGWHVPTEQEWNILICNFGGLGGKLTSTTGWNYNIGTNESGFTGLPGGSRNKWGGFQYLGILAYWWSSSERANKEPGYVTIDANNNIVYKYSSASSANGEGPNWGMSVRCLKNSSAPSTIPTVTTTAISGITVRTANGGGNITSDGGSAVTSRGVVWSVNPAPTTSTSLTTMTVDGCGSGSFSSSIKGLEPNKKIYVRAYAVNSSGTAYGNEVSFNTLGPCQGASTVKDIDGNTYNTVQIGTQCWTKENLRVTKYSDGTSIPLDNSGGTSGNGSGQTWSSSTTGARTIYAHSQTNLATYGYLYNWYAAKGIATTGSRSYKNLCPTGWHVPTGAEWNKLSTFLGGDNVAGGKMKSVTGWNAPNTGATNESGFTGLPGGYRINVSSSGSGAFNDLGTVGVWWSSTDYNNPSYDWLLDLYYSSGSVRSEYYGKEASGFSVRCLRD